ncbi:hypothetical protein DM02DRAFT_618046, partial [Periconia macrospinosa]
MWEAAHRREESITAVEHYIAKKCDGVATAVNEEAIQPTGESSIPSIKPIVEDKQPSFDDTRQTSSRFHELGITAANSATHDMNIGNIPKNPRGCHGEQTEAYAAVNDNNNEHPSSHRNVVVEHRGNKPPETISAMKKLAGKLRKMIQNTIKRRR